MNICYKDKIKFSLESYSVESFFLKSTAHNIMDVQEQEGGGITFLGKSVAVSAWPLIN